MENMYFFKIICMIWSLHISVFILIASREFDSVEGDPNFFIIIQPELKYFFTIFFHH